MPEISSTIPPKGSLPGDHQEVLHWKVTDKPSRVIILNLLGIVLFALFGVIFSVLAINLGKLDEFNFGLIELGVVLIAMVLTIVLHELIHGLFMRLYGARPRYGILWKGLMFYATSPGYAYRRNNYLVIALAPLLLISLLVILGMGLWQGTLWVALFGICGVINASGAIGDMWITMIVLRYATKAYIMDERDGIRVFLPRS
jgi:hypothetical protein